MIRIDIRLAVSGTSDSGLKRTHTGLQKISSVLDDVNSKLATMRDLLSSMPGIPKINVPSLGQGGTSRGSTSVTKPPTVRSQFQDAFDQFKFLDKMNKLSNGQHANARSDALQNAHNLAQQLAGQGKFGAMNQLLPHLMPKVAPSFASRLMSAIFSTRVGFGQGGFQIMPLIGHLMKLNPILGELSVVAGMLGTSLNMASDRAKSFLNSVVSLNGSTPGQTATAKKFADALGMDPAALGKSIEDAVASGAGAGFAVKAGINTVGGPFGDLNRADKIIKAIEYIRRASPDEARRASEAFGMPELQKVRYWSDEQVEYMKKAKPISESQIRRTEAFNFAIAKVTDTFSRINDRYAGGLMTVLTPLLKLGSVATMLSEAISGVLTPIVAIGDLADEIEKRLNFSNSNNQKAINDNTKAVQRLNNTIRETTGGGQRAQGALPRGLKGNYIDQNVINGLGAGVPL